jgi:hypothetical protein
MGSMNSVPSRFSHDKNDALAFARANLLVLVILRMHWLLECLQLIISFETHIPHIIFYILLAKIDAIPIMAF